MSEIRRLLVVGAGGHGRALAEGALLSRCFDLCGFLDGWFTDYGSQGARCMDRKVLGGTTVILVNSCLLMEK